MKIALVTLGIWPEDQPGGVQMHCHHEKRELEGLGHEVKAFRRDGSTLMFVIKTARALWKEEFDAIQVHYPTYSLFPVMISPGKLVLTFHGSDRRGKGWRLLQWFALRRAKAATATSKALAKEVGGIWIPNGI